MSANDIEEMLRAHPFCANLDHAEIAAVAAVAHVASFAPNTFVFRENGVAGHLYVIMEGVIRLELSAPAGTETIQTLDADDALGLSWLEGTPGRWMFDAQVEEAATLVVIDGPALQAACDANHTLGYKISRHLLLTTTQRLQATRIRLLDLYR